MKARDKINFPKVNPTTLSLSSVLLFFLLDYLLFFFSSNASSLWRSSVQQPIQVWICELGMCRCLLKFYQKIIVFCRILQLICLQIFKLTCICYCSVFVISCMLFSLKRCCFIISFGNVSKSQICEYSWVVVLVVRWLW